MACPMCASLLWVRQNREPLYGYFGFGGLSGHFTTRLDDPAPTSARSRIWASVDHGFLVLLCAAIVFCLRSGRWRLPRFARPSGSASRGSILSKWRVPRSVERKCRSTGASPLAARWPSRHRRRPLRLRTAQYPGAAPAGRTAIALGFGCATGSSTVSLPTTTPCSSRAFRPAVLTVVAWILIDTSCRPLVRSAG